MYKYIFFDLDGTLTDPEVGITKSVEYALNKYGIKVKNRRTLVPFIGPPLYESFEKFYGFDRENALKAIEYYREYFSVKGLFENRVYDGVYELLESLKSLGKILVIATSKPEVFTLKILEKFDIKKYFDFVAGATLDSTRVKKADVIKYALDSLKICDEKNVLMIGDREHDILGAKSHGMPSVGVLYGYGGTDELLTAGADYICKTPKEVFDLIKGL